MTQEEQSKKTSQVSSDAAAKEVIPAKPTALSEEDLDKVTGGISATLKCGTDVMTDNVIKLNCVNDKLK